MKGKNVISIWIEFNIKAAKEEKKEMVGDSVDFFSLNLGLFMFVEKMTGT